MNNGAGVSAVEGPLSSVEEREIRLRQNRIYLVDAEAAVEKIEAHLAGTKDALAIKRGEVERLRAALQEDGAE